MLVLSTTPWSLDNSFGSTYFSIFGPFRDLSVSSLYTGTGTPDARCVDEAFQMTETDLLRSIGKPGKGAGRRVFPTAEPRAENTGGDRFLEGVASHFRGRRTIGKGTVMQARRLLWLVGPWKSVELDSFVAGARPDVIFLPLYASAEINRLALHVKEQAGVPMVAYVSDDVYGLRQFSLSPVFWVRRLLLRRLLRRVLGECEWLYVVSDLQKAEYEQDLGIECHVLTKLGDFSGEAPPTKERSDDNATVVFTYAGNIGNERWKTLRDIGDAISAAKRQGLDARLDVYTMTPVRGRIRRALAEHDSVRVHAPVPAEQLKDIYAQSDVLVLAEPMSLKGRLAVRHSLSTKVVEYAATGRAMITRGPRDVASAQHLQQAKAALVSFPGTDLNRQVLDLITKPELRERLARNAWIMGQRNHDQASVAPRVEAELRNVAGLV